MKLSELLQVSTDLSLHGCAVVPEYLDEHVLVDVAEECRALLERGEGQTGRHPDSWDEICNAGNVSEVLAPLVMDPVTVALAALQLGPDIELASSGEVDRKRRRSEQSQCGWHTDFTWMPFVRRPRPFFWLTVYFFLTDVTEDSGPLWVVPGSHRWAAEPNGAVVRWTDLGNHVPDVRPLTGRAGTLMLFNNEIWHRSPPNTSDSDRLVLRTQFKPSWMKKWSHGSLEPGGALTAIDQPYARQLTGTLAYDDVPWEYGDDATYARFPVVAWLEGQGLLDRAALAQHRQPSELTQSLISEWGAGRALDP